jgi:hypothetical protein
VPAHWRDKTDYLTFCRREKNRSSGIPLQICNSKDAPRFVPGHAQFRGKAGQQILGALPSHVFGRLLEPRP